MVMHSFPFQKARVFNEAPVVEANVFIKKIIGQDPGRSPSTIEVSGIIDFGWVTFNETYGLTKF